MTGLTGSRIATLVIGLPLALYAAGCGDDDGPTETRDTTPPGAVDDLATVSVTDTSATLTWTAPGDDGASGQAAAYDLRFSRSTLTEEGWDSSSRLPGEPAPKLAGEPESLAVAGLLPDTDYFFALKSRDEVPNESDLSNVASTRTEPENRTFVIMPDGTGDFATIMDAVSAAESGDIIELIDGTYTGDGNRDIEYLGKEITIRSRNGDPTYCIIDCQASLNDPHRGFLINQGVGRNAKLKGVTIINGVQCVSCDEFALTDSELHDLSGGGIKIQGASPTIANCIVRDCQTEFTGGGISIEIDSSPLVIGCVFAGNSATQQGGGITLEFNSEPAIRACIVEGNTAQRGGGVACTQTSNGTFENCIITGNVAVEGGGFYASGSSPLLYSVTLSGNRASQLGGGISSVAGAGPGMSRSVVWGNCALGDGDSGDELYIDILSDLSLACCALDSSGTGGSGQPTYLGDNVFSDPLFCDPVSCLAAPTDEGDYRLDSQSPCLPDASPCGLLIGALHRPCEPIVTSGLLRGRGFRR